MRISKALLDMTLKGRKLARSLLALFAFGSLVKLVELLHIAYAREVEDLECGSQVVFFFFGFFVALGYSY